METCHSQDQSSARHRYAIAVTLIIMLSMLFTGWWLADHSALSLAAQETPEPTALPQLYAEPDFYTTQRDTSLTVPAPGLKANDTDWASTYATVQVDSLPTAGALTWYQDGAFTYRPPAGFTGTATFTYHLENPGSSLASSSVTVTIQVKAPQPQTGNLVVAVDVTRDQASLLNVCLGTVCKSLMILPKPYGPGYGAAFSNLPVGTYTVTVKNVRKQQVVASGTVKIRGGETVAITLP